jgi:hypothetical protein
MCKCANGKAEGRRQKAEGRGQRAEGRENAGDARYLLISINVNPFTFHV